MRSCRPYRSWPKCSARRPPAARATTKGRAPSQSLCRTDGGLLAEHFGQLLYGRQLLIQRHFGLDQQPAFLAREVPVSAFLACDVPVAVPILEKIVNPGLEDRCPGIGIASECHGVDVNVGSFRFC